MYCILTIKSPRCYVTGKVGDMSYGRETNLIIDTHDH